MRTKSVIGRVGASRIILGTAGVLMLLYGLRHQFQHGWFTISDYFPLALGFCFLAAMLLPHVIRVNIVVVLLCVFLIEFAAGSFMALENHPQGRVVLMDSSGNKIPDSRYVARNHDLGYTLAANTKTLVRQTLGEKVLFAMTVTTDNFGRRINPAPENERYDHFLAFFGGSFTFGEGVNDDATLPYFAGKLLPGYHVYNYGVGGYGPQHLLARIEGKNLSNEINESKGIGLYLYIDDHVRRVAYTMRKGWLYRSPYYVLDETHGVIRKGNFNTARPLLNAFYRDILSESRVFSLFKIDFPPVSDKDLLLTCRILKKAQSGFEKGFAESEFYVIFHPSSKRYVADLKLCFDQNNVKYWDHSDEPWPSEFRIPFDGHPSPAGHRRLAELTAPKIRSAIQPLEE